MGRRLPQPSTESIDLTNVLKALGDPVRLYLIRQIHRDEGPVDCHPISLSAGVTAATVSHHWRVLRESGLTSTIVEGRSRIIEIRYADLEKRFPGLLLAVLDAQD